jgi:hypothetical protein
MLLFSVISFQVIIFIWHEKKQLPSNIVWYKWIVFEFKENFLIFIFSILWIIVAVFSMGSTVAGQYNKYILTHKEQIKIKQHEDTTSKELLLEVLKAEENLLLSTIEEKRKYRNHIVSSLEQYNTIELQIENKRNYDNLRSRLTITDNEIEALFVKLDETRTSIRTNIQEIIYIKDTIKDFYEWISFVLNISKDIVQFGFSIIPALFIDIIAPTGVAVALFLKKRLT